MVRECAAFALLASSLGSLLGGCSLILDFDQKIPADAATDAVYTQSECDYKEPNESLDAAQVVTASDTGPAAICAAPAGGAEDLDFYKFTATGTTATISVQFVQRAGGDLDIKLYDTSGGLIAQSRGFGSTETIVCPGASPGCPMLSASQDYVLEVFAGVAGSVNSYTFSIAQ